MSRFKAEIAMQGFLLHFDVFLLNQILGGSGVQESK